MARYLVTGGAGFIGCNLVRFLLDKHQQVVVLDDLSTGYRRNLEEVMDRITMVEADVRDAAAVEGAMAGCQGVFHEAALGSVPRSVADPIASHDVNVNGTLRVLEAARKLGIKRVVFAASSSAYGDQPESPKHEGMAPMPISPYAAGKVACEAYLRAYAAVYGLQTMGLRYFNVFGPWQDPNGAYAAAIPIFVSRLLRQEVVEICGDGEQSRDFCFIENVCQANWLAMHAPAEVCNGQVVNIACHEQTTINQVYRHIARLLGSTLQPRHVADRPGDVKHSLASVERARELIGYEPGVFFADGLARSIDWYRRNLG